MNSWQEINLHNKNNNYRKTRLKKKIVLHKIMKRKILCKFLYCRIP